jgi:hypothetical protein
MPVNMTNSYRESIIFEFELFLCLENLASITERNCTMKIASLFALLLIVPVASAGSVSMMDIAEKVTTAFDQETGSFADGAFVTLSEAHAMIAEALEDESIEQSDAIGLGSLDCMVMYNLACLEALSGNTEEAFTWLEGSVEAGYGDPEWMLEDEDLTSLRDDARFQELVDAAAETAAETCTGPCSTGGECCGSGGCE